MSRRADRRDDELPVRVGKIEEDLDRVDHRFEETAGQIIHKATNLTLALEGVDRKHDLRFDKLEAKVDKGLEEAEERNDSLRKVLIGVLVSTLTATVAIAVNVLIMTGGPR